jgi:hypothetical protein
MAQSVYSYSDVIRIAAKNQSLSNSKADANTHKSNI